MSSEFEWKGYAIHDTKAWHDFKVIDFKPKTAGDYDIDIKTEFCGICGSDVHTITGGWGQPMLPVIPGHEIVGKVVRVGPKVTEFKVGDRAGVGAQVCSCLECDRCKTDNEQYCMGAVDTYNAKYENGDIAQGGYSTGVRAHERFVFKIPDAIPLEEAAPMLCAGITVFSPLVRNGAGTTAKRVGIVGVGGLGHFAVMFSKALGAEEVVVFSHSDSKKEDAMKMGATKFVITADKGYTEELAGKIDLMVVTANKGIDFDGLLPVLNMHAKMVIVAMPDDQLPPLKSQQMAPSGCFVGSSHIGSKKEINQMLALVAEKGIKPWIKVSPMAEAGKWVQDTEKGTVRYRNVLKVDI